jgi:hypothetical protein
MDLHKVIGQEGLKKVKASMFSHCILWNFFISADLWDQEGSSFQEQMAATVLLGLIYYICEVYLDDIIVHGKN